MQISREVWINRVNIILRRKYCDFKKSQKIFNTLADKNKRDSGPNKNIDFRFFKNNDISSSNLNKS